MYAVFETGGKQYKAEKGDIVFVEKLEVEPGKSVSFDALVVSDGDDVMIGTPTVKGAKIKAKVVEHGKDKKIIVFKFKPKKDYRRKQGHRQPFTKIEITGIDTPGGKSAAANRRSGESSRQTGSGKVCGKEAGSGKAGRNKGRCGKETGTGKNYGS